MRAKELPAEPRRISHVERRLSAAGYELPEVRAQGAYAVAVLHNGTIYTAGQLSRQSGVVLAGTAEGPDHLPRARLACELAVLRAIAAVRTLVDLDQVTQVIQLRGFIASSPDFEQHTQALDAASAVLDRAFGQTRGAHARSAVGVSSLPAGGLAELELTVAVDAVQMSPRHLGC